MNLILTLLAWGLQIGVTLLLAAALSALLGRLPLPRRRASAAPARRSLPRFLCCGAVLFGLLALLALRPPVICAAELREGSSPQLREAVLANSRGLYSWQLPLVPAAVHITQADGESVSYRIHYLYIGTVGMEYSVQEGYNMTKPLN